jgi:hypothetical protein
MTKVASEDSVRRALSAMQEEETGPWLQKHLQASDEPLLEEAGALDMDTTVKPLYGHQEDAQVGYNPQKPGRPSHVYHSYFIANLRIVMDVEVQAGIRPPRRLHNRSYGGYWTDCRRQVNPRFLRGDCNWGTERAMEGAEQSGIAYVFKRKQSANVKRLIAKLLGDDRWVDAGEKWPGLEPNCS